VSGENVCRYRETECDRVMGSITEQEAFVIYALTKHKVMESSEIVWAGQTVGWGNDKCAKTFSFNI
jgi:hypothetical protein